MGADYFFYVKTIETHARAFLALNILAIGRVQPVGKSNEISKSIFGSAHISKNLH